MHRIAVERWTATIGDEDTFREPKDADRTETPKGMGSTGSPWLALQPPRILS